jgi:type IV pilus assembly protein PilF
MTTIAPLYWDARRWLAWAGLLGSLLLALGGCASQQQQQSTGAGAPHDILTESDEPQARKRARIRMELALGYFENGQPNVALDELKQVIILDPTFPDAYNLRGLIYMRLNDNRQAEDSFRRAVALDPRDANVQHNLGWLLCQQSRYEDAQRAFDVALATPGYTGGAKTLMAQGICQMRAGRVDDAEKSMTRSFELDAANPVTGFQLAGLLHRKREDARAQFYIRRINNSQLANAETLWLGIKIERRLKDQVAMRQLADQLKRRFAQSPEAAAYDKGVFDE